MAFRYEFYFLVLKITIYSLTALVCKILFLLLENNIHIFVLWGDTYTQHFVHNTLYVCLAPHVSTFKQWFQVYHSNNTHGSVELN